MLGAYPNKRTTTLVALCLFFASILSTCCLAADEETEQPRYRNTNVIMISIDTLRHDHLGCYGYSRGTSENIDQLAAQSVVFDNFISQAILTPVSQMSIFTSQYPRVNGVVSFQPAIELIKTKMFPEILKTYGYTNAAFLSSPEFLDSRYTNTRDGVNNTQKLFSRAFDYYIHPRGTFRGVPEEALQWIRENKESKFFLWLPIGTVHWPYSSSVPAPYRAQFDPPGYTPFFYDAVKYPAGRKLTDAVDADVLSYIYMNRFYGNTSNPYDLTDLDTKYIISRYDAGVLYSDLFVGRLLSLLDKLDLSRNTLVVLYSTHGEDLGEHGYYGHYDLYDTETKNALMIRFPQNRYGGKRFIPQAQGIDIVPTVLDYLSIPIHHEAQGVSLMPEIAGDRRPEGNAFAYITKTPLFEFVLFKGRRLFVVATRKTDALGSYMDILKQNFESFDPQCPPYDIAVRTNEWKLILRNHVPMQKAVSWWGFVTGRAVDVKKLELYDLTRDPSEQMDVASRHPEVVELLVKKVKEWDASVTDRAIACGGKAERVLIPYP